MSTKAPGLFESIRKLVYGGVRLVDDGSQTARLLLVPIQAEAIVEAQDVLKENNLTLETFKSSKDALLM